jgi:hypothetical protein
MKTNNLWEELIAFYPLLKRDRTENDASNSSFVAGVKFWPSRCPATIEGFLPTRYLATIVDKHTD